ncbi:MAG: DUF1922 domain-containing protein [Candidatus Lokiarchaeota archaeon]|nr:DUF1922 domain-containing protein [Candidatus Lokiarchaeota archaeon]
MFNCYKCGTPLYAEEFQKTKKCPNCNKTINLRIAKKLKYVDDLKLAVEIVKQLKAPEEVRKEIINNRKKETRKKPVFRRILAIIKKLSDRYERGFTKAQLKDELDEFGFNNDKFQKLLNKLIYEGYIYELRYDHYKMIS